MLNRDGPSSGLFARLLYGVRSLATLFRPAPAGVADCSGDVSHPIKRPHPFGSFAVLGIG